MSTRKYKAGDPLSGMNEGEVLGKYFTIQNVSKTFDGLDVKVSSFALGGALVSISVIRRSDVLLGDRPLQEAVTPDSFFIPKSKLVMSKFQDEMEFSSKNDFGEFVSSNRLERQGYEIVVTRYTNALVVEIFTLVKDDKAKPVFSKTFFEKSKIDVARGIIWCFEDGTYGFGETERHLKEIK